MRNLKRLLIFLGILLVLFGTAYLLRGPLLRAAGNFLIAEDEIKKVDAVFVLSGGAYERSREAANIYKSGFAPRIITTGKLESQVLKALGMRISDAELSKQALLSFEVPDSLITTLKEGTSTFEESEHILGFSEHANFNRIAVVTSKFHTRRARWVFRKKFKDSNIDVFITGADPENYDISRWWEYEESLIFVNNEYVKLLYYLWKY
ncbi:MAG: YdcF family protein [Bacteroidetes bacterium]|nr:MAG: YdcF family protein [Bacteroidota bacterium]